jgi:hypothetical protein
MWFLIIWFISCFWALCFVPWCAERNISLGITIFSYICPVFNTIFAAYRTYRHFKNGGSIKFLKDLFAE